MEELEKFTLKKAIRTHKDFRDDSGLSKWLEEKS